jgi:hypothetical protein
VYSQQGMQRQLVPGVQGAFGQLGMWKLQFDDWWWCGGGDQQQADQTGCTFLSCSVPQL